MPVSAHTTTKLIIILTLLAQKACGTEIIHFIIKARLFIKTPEEYKIDSQSHKFPRKWLQATREMCSAGRSRPEIAAIKAYFSEY